MTSAESEEKRRLNIQALWQQPLSLSAYQEEVRADTKI